MTLPSLTGLRIRQLEAERDELTAALGQAREIAAVLEEQNAAALRIHRQDIVGHRELGHLCAHDSQPWPCPTFRALGGLP